MTEKEYREHPAISRSELFKISESPEKFKWYREHPEPTTPSLIFGQLFHALALTPETEAEQFAIAPNIDRRTKDGKEHYAKFEATVNGRTIVTLDMYEQAREMSQSLYDNALVRKLLNGNKEQPFFWTDEMTGEECKCRTDCITEVNGTQIIVDLKTADSADTESFMRASIKYGYDLQAAMYSEGVKSCTGKDSLFVFVVIEKKPPYAINIFQADKAFIQRGQDLFREYLGIYHECKTSGNWYGYLGAFNQINSLTLPAWLAKEGE